jgi:hypothetical protein
LFDIDTSTIPSGANTFTLLFETSLDSSGREKVFIDNVVIQNVIQSYEGPGECDPTACPPVPEPTATLLLGIGLLGLIGYGWVRKQDGISDNS